MSISDIVDLDRKIGNWICDVSYITDGTHRKYISRDDINIQCDDFVKFSGRNELMKDDKDLLVMKNGWIDNFVCDEALSKKLSLCGTKTFSSSRGGVEDFKVFQYDEDVTIFQLLYSFFGFLDPTLNFSSDYGCILDFNFDVIVNNTKTKEYFKMSKGNSVGMTTFQDMDSSFCVPPTDGIHIILKNYKNPKTNIAHLRPDGFICLQQPMSVKLGSFRDHIRVSAYNDVVRNIFHITFSGISKTKDEMKVFLDYKMQPIYIPNNSKESPPAVDREDGDGVGELVIRYHGLEIAYFEIGGFTDTIFINLPNSTMVYKISKNKHSIRIEDGLLKGFIEKCYLELMDIISYFRFDPENRRRPLRLVSGFEDLMFGLLPHSQASVLSEISHKLQREYPRLSSPEMSILSQSDYYIPTNYYIPPTLEYITKFLTTKFTPTNKTQKFKSNISSDIEIDKRWYRIAIVYIITPDKILKQKLPMEMLCSGENFDTLIIAHKDSKTHINKTRKISTNFGHRQLFYPPKSGQIRDLFPQDSNVHKWLLAIYRTFLTKADQKEQLSKILEVLLIDKRENFENYVALCYILLKHNTDKSLFFEAIRKLTNKKDYIDSQMLENTLQLLESGFKFEHIKELNYMMLFKKSKPHVTKEFLMKIRGFYIPQKEVLVIPPSFSEKVWASAIESGTKRKLACIQLMMKPEIRGNLAISFYDDGIDDEFLFTGFNFYGAKIIYALLSQGGVSEEIYMVPNHEEIDILIHRNPTKPKVNLLMPVKVERTMMNCK